MSLLAVGEGRQWRWRAPGVLLLVHVVSGSFLRTVRVRMAPHIGMVRVLVRDGAAVVLAGCSSAASSAAAEIVSAAVAAGPSPHAFFSELQPFGVQGRASECTH